MLNAALAIDIYDGSPQIIAKHCELWRPFIVKLLETWIERTRLNQAVFVRLWGHESNGDVVKVPNHAQELWKEISKAVLGTASSKNKFHIMEAHHPTCSQNQNINNFVNTATSDFQKIVGHDCYNDVFDIDVEGIVETFLYTRNIREQFYHSH